MYLPYGGGFTRTHLTEMEFAKVEVPFEFDVVDTVKGEHRSARFLDINPSGFGAINRCVEAGQNRSALRALWTGLGNRTGVYAEMDQRGDRIQ